MLPKVGDIVEVLPGAPYVVTRPGSTWVVYQIIKHPTGRYLVQIGSQPESYDLFQQYLSYLDDTYKSKEMRRRTKLTLFSVFPEFLKTVGCLGSNKQFSNLLKQTDIWETEKNCVPKAKFKFPKLESF